MKAATARTGHRGLRIAGLLALVVPALIASGGGLAEAATPASPATTPVPNINHGNWQVIYDKTWNWTSNDLPRCIKIEFTGNITYSLNLGISGRFATYNWTNQKINDPRIDIYVTAEGIRSSCPGFSANLDSADMRQAWTGFACSFNPSLGVSFPWGISFSGWPSCGSRNQLERSTTGTGVHNHYFQANSGAPGSFGNYTSVATIVAPCYGVFPTITIHSNGGTDTFIGGAQKVCLPWH